MFKFVFNFVFLASLVFTASYSQQSEDNVPTTHRSKLLRVPLKRFEGEEISSAHSAPRQKRSSLHFQFTGSESELNNWRDSLFDSSNNVNSQVEMNDSPKAGVFQLDSNGFQEREAEERLAEHDNLAQEALSDDQLSEVTDGRLLIDDEAQRFEVESSSQGNEKKVREQEEFSIFY